MFVIIDFVSHSNNIMYKNYIKKNIFKLYISRRTLKDVDIWERQDFKLRWANS